MNRRRKRRERDLRELGKRAKRVNRSDAEQQARDLLAVARSDRDAARRVANVEYDQAVEKAMGARTAARKDAEDTYESERLVILKALAKATEKAA